MSETASQIISNYRRVRSVFWQDPPKVVNVAPPEPPKRDIIDLASYPYTIDDHDEIMPRRGRAIVAEVAHRHGVTMTDIVSHRRDARSSLARHIAMWRMHRETPLTMPQIGRILGGRDHTTILHGIRKIDRLIAEGKVVAR
ncbi:helix-turn-helix domain-containing protein [Pseudochelatococcus sp. B33]